MFLIYTMDYKPPTNERPMPVFNTTYFAKKNSKPNYTLTTKKG